MQARGEFDTMKFELNCSVPQAAQRAPRMPPIVWLNAFNWARLKLPWANLENPEQPRT